ncbi:adenine deaminase [Selenihalanaerobacter shriftii]|uniref:Adenine deaminase n=1 Tax=Selenihalanaerobacter shriftii TaxID=142842 RepID=A0A1T4PKF6_9FIRM|nr:adenine deaminase [Selenihalanaerobacter shriftii]SJZ91831.1 Adenine deaminase [Selenihalanaerobacter shriftii]
MDKKLLKQARGEEKVDILFKNGRVVDVFNGEIVEENVAVADGKVIGYGDYQGKEEIDLDGRILSPGFIDGHLHIESGMVEVKEFARQVIASGTTTIFADPHEIANVSGMKGIEYIYQGAKELPWNLFLMFPSAVPAASAGTPGAIIDAQKMSQLFSEEKFFGLGEVMDFINVIAGDDKTWEKLEITGETFKDGHAPGVSGKELNAYLMADIGADHECTTAKEAIEKIRSGMYVMIREGSATKDLLNLLPGINSNNMRRFLLATDDRHPQDLVEEGHINFLMKKLHKSGINPVEAIRLGTINAAECFGLDNLGAIAPGYQADLVVIDDFDNWNIDMVFKDGKMVAKEGESTFSMSSKIDQDLKKEVMNSVNIGRILSENFELLKGNKFRVMELSPDQIITKQQIVNLSFEETEVKQELIKNDLVKIAVVDRHQATGNVGLGLLKGFGLEEGAIATSIAHDSHHIITAGLDKDDMYRAVKKVEELDGGIVIVKEGEVLAKLPLSIAGLMSKLSLDEVAIRINKMKEITESLGVKIREPFMTLSFMALPVIPELKITDKGLFDVKQLEYVQLNID